MNNRITLFIDFDSTFIQEESLDLLADIVLTNHPKKAVLMAQIAEITRLGMEGKIPFSQSLRSRMELFSPTKYHLKVLIDQLNKKVTPSIEKHISFFQRHAKSIYILSSGFRQYMIPVVERFGIPQHHVFGNTLLLDSNGTISGYDASHVLAKDGGKVKLLQRMQKENTWYMVGDGHTDYQLKEAGMVDKFFAFTENITREHVCEKADIIASSFDMVLANL